MAITASSRFQGVESSIENLKSQIMECPPKENRFIKRGMEYLCLHGVYDVLEVEDCLIDRYALWIRQQGIKDENLIRLYQRTLIGWREFHREKEFLKLRNEMEECDTVKPTLKNKAYGFLIMEGIHSLTEIDWEVRHHYEEYLSGVIHGKDTQSWYLRGLDKLKLFDIEKKNSRFKAGRKRLKYQDKVIFLGYHPDCEIAKDLYYCRNEEKTVWDFSIRTSGKLKYQVFTILSYALENAKDRELTDGYLGPLQFFYKYSVGKGISDLTILEQEQIDDYVEETKKLDLVNNRYHQIVEKAQRILFLQAKEINWEANVWYLDRFQFDESRYDPSRPVKRISFLEIADQKNRGILKQYVKYQLGVTSSSVQSIWRQSYITKAFLRYLDEKKLAVDQLTAAEIEPYFRRLQNENAKIATFNDKVTEIHSFFRFLTVRGYYEKVPFFPEYYLKREPVPHHYRSVPQNTVTEILKNLRNLPEDLRLMYLHLWCLGLRINEVCTIKREGYYLKEDVAWLRIHQHKMKMEKVIPLPMMLYRVMMVYIERKGILQRAYVFQDSRGGPYSSTYYWHEMVKWCNDLGIRCGDHVFQTHDYRHSVATALYEHGASMQAIREFLGHKHENMTKRYIDCIQEHLDCSSEQYYKEHQSLAGEWKRGSGEDGN